MCIKIYATLTVDALIKDLNIQDLTNDAGIVSVGNKDVQVSFQGQRSLVPLFQGQRSLVPLFQGQRSLFQGQWSLVPLFQGQRSLVPLFQGQRSLFPLSLVPLSLEIELLEFRIFHHARDQDRAPSLPHTAVTR